MTMESVLLGLAFVALCVLALKAPKLFTSRAPVKTAKATVLGRRGEIAAGALPTQWGGHPTYQVSYSVGEETITLTVDAAHYTRLLEGTSGLLTWRDNTLVDFVPEG